MKIKSSTLLVIIFVLLGVSISAQKKFSIHLSGHYGFHFKTNTVENSEGQKGRLGHGLEFRYYLGDQSKKISTAIGIAYNRFGFQREFLWTDATPENEELYGTFPITYKIWDDVHYISIPFYINMKMEKRWKISVTAALDYPIGTGYYRDRRSADGMVSETVIDRFNSTKLYPWNTSIGAGLLIGKTIPLNEKIDLFIESQFKVYTLLSFRSNDYFPHDENIRPFTWGINIGLKF
jgi:hypothetical protein